MHRRALLKSAAASAILPGLVAALPAGAAVSSRVRPGDAGWPDDAAWEGLKQAVGGRLIKPVALTAPCEIDPKAPACTDLFKELANPYYIGDQAGGTQVSGWLDAWKPGVSAWAVKAASTADVAAAVNFARNHNLRLVVKGGGHSYQGTSNAAEFPSRLDPDDERHHRSRRLHSQGLRGQGRAGPGRLHRRRRHVGRCLQRRDHKGGTLRSGGRLRHRRRGGSRSRAAASAPSPSAMASPPPRSSRRRSSPPTGSPASSTPVTIRSFSGPSRAEAVAVWGGHPPHPQDP